MRSPLNILVIAILVFTVYIVYTGSATLYDLITGAVVAIVVGILFSSITITNALKALNPRRWFYLVAYALRYFIVDETRAHVDVIRRILDPKLPVSPAIVKVPYDVETDYAKTAIACSITNTPGTVVVDIDEDQKVFYVHWIGAVDEAIKDPQAARRHISEVFEIYSKKIFD
uniref:Cation:proton antiporter n=1 Tax=Ignisphaera aggregans TaxID=334771 RepID=A0A7C2ZLZ0_9CREN